MKRKLIKQGGGGYTVYLPKKWIDERHLKAGDQIDVDETENALVLSTEAKIKKDATLSFTDETYHLLYLKLSLVYRMGFDKIIVTFTNQKTMHEISKIATDYLLGFEITEKTKNSCVLENVTEPTDEKFNVLIRRLFLQIKEIHSLMKEDFQIKKKAHADEIQRLHISFDKHIFFCRRCISKKMNIEGNAILHWELLSMLLHTHHAFYYLYKKYDCQQLHKKTFAIFSALEPYFQYTFAAYFEKNSAYLDAMQKTYHALQEQIFTALNNKQNNDKVILSFLKELVHFVQIIGSPLRALLTDVHTAQK